MKTKTHVVSGMGSIIDNPREAVKYAWSREPAFYSRFLAHVLTIVDSNPRAGKGPAKTALIHAPTACLQVQGLGLWAHRATGDLDTADQAIENGFFYSDDCPSCIADLHRRRAVLRRNRYDFDGAKEHLKAAIDELRDACGPRMMACLVTWKALEA